MSTYLVRVRVWVRFGLGLGLGYRVRIRVRVSLGERGQELGVHVPEELDLAQQQRLTGRRDKVRDRIRV